MALQALQARRYVPKVPQIGSAATIGQRYMRMHEARSMPLGMNLSPTLMRLFSHEQHEAEQTTPSRPTGLCNLTRMGLTLMATLFDCSLSTC